MTQNELETKLNGYDLKGADAYDLIWRNDNAREMATNYEHMSDAILAYLKTRWAWQPTDEVKETAEKLLDLIFDEKGMYRKHSALIKRELMARLEQEESND